MNIRALSASLSLSMASLAAFATDYAWVGASAGEWTEPSNWSPSTGYPNGADDTAMFAPSAATAVTVASPIGVRWVRPRLHSRAALPLLWRFRALAVAL